MWHFFLPVAPLFAGLGVMLLGHGLLYTLLPVSILAHGMPQSAAGHVASAYFLGQGLGVLAGRGIVESVGHIRAFAVFAALAASTTLAFPLFPEAAYWSALRVLFGVSMAGIFMTAESWLNAAAANEVRGRMLSLYMITTYLAMGAGQFLLDLADPRGFQLFSLAAMLFATALIPIALIRTASPAIERRPYLSPLRLYRISPLGFAGALVGGWVLSPFYGLAPIVAAEAGRGVFPVSAFMGAAIFGGLLMQWPLGRLSDRFDRRAVMIGAALSIAVVSVAMLGFAYLGPAALLPGAFVFGGVLMVLYPLSVGHTNDFLEKGDLVQAAGGLILTFAFGAVIGPFVAARVMAVVGPAGLFIHIGLSALALAGFGLYRMTRRPPVPPALKEPFAAHLPTSPVASGLAPEPEAAGMELQQPPQPAAEGGREGGREGAGPGPAG
ncbi:MAG: MFS transporter [Proteobacteria bacterium]|nr:MFS transporter [Pseudomonadota bacterium]